VRRAVVAGAAAVTVLAGGCGQPSADLFTMTRGGSIPGARLRLRVTDDGHVSCNGGALVEITSKQLIDARDAARELSKPAGKHVSLPARAGSTLNYAFTIDEDTVRFADNSAGQDPAMYRAALLVRQLAQGPCHLPR
jgi:hypothetical protein